MKCRFEPSAANEKNNLFDASTRSRPTRKSFLQLFSELAFTHPAAEFADRGLNGFRMKSNLWQHERLVNRLPCSAAPQRRGIVQRIFLTNFRVKRLRPLRHHPAVVRVRPEPPSGGRSQKRSPFSLQGARLEGRSNQAEKRAGLSGMTTSCRSRAALRGGFAAAEADDRRPVPITTAFRSCSARPR